MDKATVVRRLIEAVAADLEAVAASQKSTQEGAVHEEAKADSDKDTRAIESQYLARGLAQRVEELSETLAALQAMPVRSFGPDDAVGISALVEVEEEESGVRRYLVAPRGGGRKVEAVVVVTPSSPVGRALLGKQVGDEVSIRTPGGVKEGELIRLS